MDDRSRLTTEKANPKSAELHRLSVFEAFDLINSEDATVAHAVAAARALICQAIELIVDALRAGGRLLYAGAGTSGRLGVLDSTECPPTFLTDPTIVRGIIAGGPEALTRSLEGAEDSFGGGATAINEAGVVAGDVVFGITTGGTTPWVHGALGRARELGCKTVFFACVPYDQVPDDADVSIRVITGPEVLTGSTRMKAGTATKMVLNMVTTIAMVRTGRVYRNLMVDVNTSTCAKLLGRGTNMVSTVTGLGQKDALCLLERAGGYVKTAIVMHNRRVDRSEAEQLLHEADQYVGQVIDG